MTLSSRGMLAKAPARPDMQYIFDAQKDLYHPDTNVNGYLSLLVAGNKMNLKMLMTKFQEVSSSKLMPAWVSDYADMKGHEELRKAAASMMEKTWIKVPVDHTCLAFQAGASAILDQLAWTLCEDGDSMLTPAPLYPAFPNDFKARARVDTERIFT